MNDSATALRHYRRAVELWKVADPGLQALAAEAAKRVTALEVR
jgi:hypothetical protein